MGFDPDSDSYSLVDVLHIMVLRMVNRFTFHRNRSLVGGGMFIIGRELHFCYGHRLLGYEGKCRYLHGHNGRVILSLAGQDLDDKGMIVDFTQVKQVVGHWIDNHIDHRMLLHRDDPALPYLQQLEEKVFVMDENPTAENIAKLIFNCAVQKGFPIREVKFWETEYSFAIYRKE